MVQHPIRIQEHQHIHRHLFLNFHMDEVIVCRYRRVPIMRSTSGHTEYSWTRADNWEAMQAEAARSLATLTETDLDTLQRGHYPCPRSLAAKAVFDGNER